MSNDKFYNDDLVRAVHCACAFGTPDGETHHKIVQSVKSVIAHKDAAYDERNKLVVLLSKIFPSHLERHPKEDKEWEGDWRWIVFVNLPTGQCTWHIHDRQLEWFGHLKRLEGHTWDGHTTEQKYERIERFSLSHRVGL